MKTNRRNFLRSSLMASTAAMFGIESQLANSVLRADVSSSMRFGLVTYLWGKDMDLPTLLETCEKSGLLGVELRTEHAHGVEPTLSPDQRLEIRKRFSDSPVTLVGYGSNAQFHEDDPRKVQHNIELTKQYIHLMSDCGGTGVKVKPNGFVKGVARDKTIEQIGQALNEVAKYGENYGQEIRVEAHGKGTSELPVMKAIFAVAEHPNVAICWNSNDVDLQGNGLEHNFDLVKERFGATVHVRELDGGKYPYDQLMKLFNKLKYSGWILLEARSDPSNKVTAMAKQRQIFDQLVRAN